MSQNRGPNQCSVSFRLPFQGPKKTTITKKNTHTAFAKPPPSVGSFFLLAWLKSAKAPCWSGRWRRRSRSSRSDLGPSGPASAPRNTNFAATGPDQTETAPMLAHFGSGLGKPANNTGHPFLSGTKQRATRTSMKWSWIPKKCQVHNSGSEHIELPLLVWIGDVGI